MKEIFLTGANGFVGKHLLRRLIEMGYHVETDMRYLHTSKYDCVIHLAAKTDISCDFNPGLIESNIVLTKEIFKVNSRIIFGSSCSARHLSNPYAYTKRYGEHLCELHGDALALRFFNIYGPGASRGIVKFLMDTPDKSKITIRGPELLRSYIHVDDVVDYILEIVSQQPKYIPIGVGRGKKVFKLNTPTGVTDVGPAIGHQTMDVVNLFQEISGKTFNISIVEAGENEPKEMVSSNHLMCMDLETGLKKTIKQ